MTQRIGDASLCADADSDRGVDYLTHCAHLDLTVSKPTLATAHSIALTDLTPATAYYCQAISAIRVRSLFPPGQREEGFQPRSAGCG